ncbi:N-acetyltransferase [Mesorhizobium tamadayense]|uniref:N-acetyltransferase n=1 Tax=Mesorhizobium tamadayense TaxID=425306 RepID=A0A3P3FM48_9HYPH|nr:N-acetyltransferase [Mesorhizobium tamadayense]
MVGTIIWWPFGQHYARFGMLIVSPSMQRRGLGRSLMEAARGMLATGRCFSMQLWRACQSTKSSATNLSARYASTRRQMPCRHPRNCWKAPALSPCRKLTSPL